MPLEFIKSQRRKDLLVQGGFLYKKDREGKEKIIWRCNEIKNCPGRAHTMQDIIKSIEHNHVPDIAKIEANKTINLIKEYATTTVTTTRGILGETSAQLPYAVAGQLPSIKSLKKTIQRARKTVEASAANPQSYNFEIPNKFKNTLDSEQFLLLLKKKYKDSSKRLIQICNNLSDFPSDEVLQGIAHNLKFYK